VGKIFESVFRQIIYAPATCFKLMFGFETKPLKKRLVSKFEANFSTFDFHCKN